jgi:hypothetical protein
MARQYFTDGPFLDPQIANGAALVLTTSEALWSGPAFTPIFANDPKAGKIYIVEAGGVLSTNAAASTLTISPLYGAVALGASQAQTVPASLTNVPWTLRMVLVFRSIGVGTTSTCVATGQFECAGAAGTAGSALSVIFGGTPATVDATVNSSLVINKILSVAGSMTTQYAFVHSLN